MATFTYESLKYKLISPTVKGNLDLLDDSAIIKLGADDDLQITHTGSAATITNTTGDTTLDLAGDLIIDVDGADVLLKDAGTQFGAFSNSSGHLLIKDGSTTFLTGAGAAATFASTLAVTGVLTADAGVNIDNITIDGTEIDLSSGDLTIDVAGDIILDAAGEDVILQGGGTQYAAFTKSGNNLIIKSGTTTAATFSGANVTFAGSVAGTTLDFSGAADIDGALEVGAITSVGNMAVTGTITASDDITAFSSEVLKDDIRTIDNALNKVADMRGVYFTKNGEAGTGVIAEEVEAVLPEVVKDGKYKSVAYGNIVGVLIEAVKELKEEVKSLKENS
jgi:hypothetical protein